MRRIVISGLVSLPLVLLSGCHLCHKRHHQPAAYIESDACACTTSYSTPVTSAVPLTYESAGAPTSQIIPSKSTIPGPPAAATH
jgi:hypothetical protein